jgi:hypothetical protein
VRENKCKARYIATQKDCATWVGIAMTESTEDTEAIEALANKYLNLWTEYWSACLAAPETAAAMARLFTSRGGITPEAGLAGFDAVFGRLGARDEPAPLRTAPNAGDGRVDELEKRVAELERRLADRTGEPVAVAAGPAKPRSRTRGT